MTVHHTMKLEVRHYECDAYNHVNNAHYLNYLEFARETLLRDAGLDYPGWIKAGQGIFVSEASLSFLNPAAGGDILTIVSSPADLGAAWVLLRQDIFAAEKPILEARIKLVWVNAAGRPTRIPGDWRARFAEQSFTGVSSAVPR